MKLVFIYGGPAAGKLTIARHLAGLTGFKLFHNHLVVDAVGALFEFGSPPFRRLREQFWLESFSAAAGEGTSIIFTFQPEPTVAPDFPEKVAEIIRDSGGETVFVSLTLARDEQLKRIANTDRAAFGKMRDADLLANLQADFESCERAMPKPAISIDTGTVSAADAAQRIFAALNS